MKLENRVFSQDRIQKLANDFVCVKIDPRVRGVDRAPFRYKSTRFVPEVVVVASGGGKVLGRVTQRTVAGVESQLRSSLAKAR